MGYKRLSIEYLVDKGFTPFKETEDVISYGKKEGDYYIGIEHHNWQVKSSECYADWWVLLISGFDLRLQCNCDTVDKFVEIIKTFNLKRFL